MLLRISKYSTKSHNENFKIRTDNKKFKKENSKKSPHHSFCICTNVKKRKEKKFNLKSLSPKTPFFATSTCPSNKQKLCLCQTTLYLDNNYCMLIKTYGKIQTFNSGDITKYSQILQDIITLVIGR